jgi:hypothetical protein
MEAIESDWKELEIELTSFQKKHIEYVKKLEEVEQMKKDYLVKFSRYSKKLKQINSNIKKLTDKNKLNDKLKNENSSDITETNDNENKTDDAKTKIELIKNKVDENLSYMSHISDTFPRPNGLD